MSESNYCSYHAVDRKEAFHAASITACPYCEIDRLKRELEEWYSVFGHLSRDADEAGNILNETRSSLEAELTRYRNGVEVDGWVDYTGHIDMHFHDNTLAGQRVKVLVMREDV